MCNRADKHVMWPITAYSILLASKRSSWEQESVALLLVVVVDMMAADRAVAVAVVGHCQ